MARVSALYRHPVKGLSPEPLESAALPADQHFPGDRLFALENGPSGFDPKAAENLPKMRFLMLMRNERLSRLVTTYDDATGTLAIRQGGQLAADGDIRTEAGRQSIERFLESFMEDGSGHALNGPVKLLTAPPGHRFMDSRAGFVSILNTATITAIAGLVGRESLDPRRFRGNILIEGLEAFAENALVRQRVRLGAAELAISKRIDRCAAVDVDPGAGLRDLTLVQALERAYGHHDCGVYAQVTKTGTIRIGDRLTPITD